MSSVKIKTFSPNTLFFLQNGGMKIYTKMGDSGETGLYGGARVSKDDLRIQAYGTLDELNATLGVAGADPLIPIQIREKLRRVQSELFQLGGELATPAGKSVPMELIGTIEIERMEKEIDAMELLLKPLTQFILPGGSLASAQIHLARTISRRAEREVVTLHGVQPLRDEILGYVNRLSDWFFVLARFANHLAGIEDTAWIVPQKAK